MDPNAVYPAGFPAPNQTPPNTMAFYQNSVPQYPQSKTPIQPGHQQHSFGAVQMQPGGPTGAMMSSGFPQQSNAAPPMDNFSASFTQPPVPASMNQFSQPGTATNTPSTVAQTFSQNMASLSANNMLPNQQKALHMNSPMNPHMNAHMNAQMNQQMNQPMSHMNNSPHVTQPGTPVQGQGQGQGRGQTPTAAQIQAQVQGQSQISQPQSPAQAQAAAAAATREKARVATLLDINSTLLQEVLNLQSAGKAGTAANADANAPGEQGADATKAAGQKPSQEYIECMRRLQANLAYLATIADRAKKASGVTPQPPAIMTAPPNLPAVKDLYVKLNELFSNPGKASTPQKLGPGTTHGNGGPSPSPVTEQAV
ncbi:hypothetical protein N7450_008285 [Penicillium hetheringtonii]|uniref:Uncharacterized protein n=1 Tax=Penicillium hetheringtonii TaxID=911720 RepID=A0AAD6DFU8_9EURO|nr:hypothetical protein N7450_008285 [Penicillium hetheringtonii]